MTVKAKILCLSEVAHCPHVLDPLREVAEVCVRPARQDILLAEIVNYDAYFAGLCVRVDREVLDKTGKLRVIATPSTGLDHIDLEAAAEHNVAVLSLKNDREFLDGVTATAELAWGLLLACVRKVPSSFGAACNGEWARDRFRGHQLSGKTFGILGYGRLGAMVAEYAKAFRMRVLAHDIREQVTEGVAFVDKETLFRESDVVSVHVHLTKETIGLVGQREFEWMKDEAILVNTSRGAVIDEKVLLNALESGRLGGAGVDVIHGEWSENLADHPLIRYARNHDNLIITPHVGGVTYESQAMAFRHTAEKLSAFLIGSHGRSD